MKISASLYSNRNRNIVELVQELRKFKVDYLHIDCNDDPNVFQDIKHIRQQIAIPIDLHIIAPHPSQYFQDIEDSEIELVCFQYEDVVDKRELEQAAALTSKIGLAIKTDTPLDVFADYSSQYNFMLFMTTTPGQSGGVFDPKNFERIRQFRELYPSKHTHVDGGVNETIAPTLKMLGVDCAVSGSYLVRSECIGHSLIKMQTNLHNLEYPVRDFMRGRNELPILDQTPTFENLLQTIDIHKLGFAFIVDENQMLQGIVTDGDIRRYILKNLELPPSEIDLRQLINRTPLVVKESESISDLLEIIRSHNRSIAFFPVVDSKNRLVGALSFNELLKGHS